jgi:hypothetical protein
MNERLNPAPRETIRRFHEENIESLRGLQRADNNSLLTLHGSQDPAVL